MSAGSSSRDVDDGNQFCYRSKPDETPSEAVLAAVATLSGRDAIPNSITDDRSEALEPLSDWINPDALDTLFRTTGDRAPATGSLTFPYCGYEVTVERKEIVTVTVREKTTG
ncbi:HalOD1 output domain-containing protein [Haladaptatus sp. NG-SE-30]